MPRRKRRKEIGFLERTAIKSVGLGLVSNSTLSPALKRGTESLIGVSILNDSFATFLKTGKKKK